MLVLRKYKDKPSETMVDAECVPLPIILTEDTLPEYITTTKQGDFPNDLSSTNCPIALFLRKAIKPEYRLSVGSLLVMLSSTSQEPLVMYDSLLPYDAAQWISNYDRWYLMFQDSRLPRAKDITVKKQELAAKMSDLNVVIYVPEVCVEM